MNNKTILTALGIGVTIALFAIAERRIYDKGIDERLRLAETAVSALSARLDSVEVTQDRMVEQIVKQVAK